MMSHPHYTPKSDTAGYYWIVLPASVSDDDARSYFTEPNGWIAGPGQRFAWPAVVRRTATRVLVAQFHGIDV